MTKATSPSTTRATRGALSSSPIIENFLRFKKGRETRSHGHQYVVVAASVSSQIENRTAWPKNLFVISTPKNNSVIVPSVAAVPVSVLPVSVPAPESQSSSDQDIDLSDWDCELLCRFCDLVDDDEQLLTSPRVSSDSSAGDDPWDS
jgi:hypothetical protein